MSPSALLVSAGKVRSEIIISFVTRMWMIHQKFLIYFCWVSKTIKKQELGQVLTQFKVDLS